MIQDIKDRVPVNVLSNNAIRYGIYDEQGNLVRYEYIKREDEPVEIGTPINRALFSNIQGDLHTQDRYNTPIITRDYVPVSYKTDIILSEELIQGDCIPKDWTFSNFDEDSLTAISTSGDIKLYYKNQSGYVDESKNGINIFDGDENTYESFRVYSTTSRAMIEFDRYVKIKKFKLKLQATDYGVEFDAVGSDDNVNFTTLYSGISFQEADGEFLEYEIAIPQYFKYFGIKVSDTTSTSLSVYELQVTEYYDNVVFGIPRYINNLLLPLTSYEVGKIVRIKGSSYTGAQYVTKTGNIIPKTWTKVSPAEYVADDGTKLTSSPLYSDEILSDIFDGDTSTSCRLGLSTSNWVKLEFPEAVCITKMYVNANLSGNNHGFYLQVSEDNSTWTTLHTEDGDYDGNISTNLVPSQKYKFYRLESYSSAKILFSPHEWQTVEYMELDPTVEITSFENPYININNLGAKQINGTIEAGEKYKLVYNGESFDILHVPQQFLPLNGSENEVLAKVGNYAEWQKRPTKVLGSLGYDSSSPNHTYTHNFERYKIYKLTLWGKVRTLTIGSGSKSDSTSCSSDNYEKTCVCEIYFWTIPSSGAYGQDNTTTNIMVIKNSSVNDIDQHYVGTIGDISKSKSLYVSSTGSNYATPVFYSSLLEEVLTEW